jgi:hypothetical protein
VKGKGHRSRESADFTEVKCLSSSFSNTVLRLSQDLALGVAAVHPTGEVWDATSQRHPFPTHNTPEIISASPADIAIGRRWHRRRRRC